MSETTKKKTSEATEMVAVTLPRDRSGNADPRGVYVAVNGVAMFVPRGKTVEIPKPYYDVLMNSMKAEDEADEFNEKEEMLSKTVIDM